MGNEFVAGDTGSTLRVTCLDNETGLPLDLNSRTVWIKWKSNGTIPAGLPKQMDKVDPQINGVAEYLFAAGELVAGVMEIEVEVREAGGNSVRNLDLLIETVREALA